MEFQYKIIFGENDNHQAGSLGWFLYILFTLFMNIVMLNLLISILGNTFEKQMSMQNSDDLRQVCKILIEQGQLFGNIIRQFRSFYYKITEEEQEILEHQYSYLHMFSEIRFSPNNQDRGDAEEQDQW